MSKQLSLSKFQHCVGTRHAVGVSATDTIMLTAHVENIDVALGYRGSSATYLTERMNIKLNNKQAFSNQLIFTHAVSAPMFPSKVGNSSFITRVPQLWVLQPL